VSGKAAMCFSLEAEPKRAEELALEKAENYMALLQIYGLAPTAPARIREFRDYLTIRGVEAVVRRSRGLDIDAACGQLRVMMERKHRALI